ncbi:unnamed protein product [Cuscuta campestris]|uniref:RecF/RecN/SMC N-terminal domain-containing protein n=1 Tax=Cuscuta campestris TaxID=132261 RepID=A0A484LYM4_9ASTE|nr:unnamed protein product [Cuscuta campestris]
MPQDASSSSVHDTRGLSGGERSFSTLCFALALHEMIESPFRAMDEFDVFMVKHLILNLMKMLCICLVGFCDESGGERSFSTLCFALALHEMIESPFRAMDEFDVFMDAVSRKISLDALVDFALAQGSQWIFMTPHDISMVKQDERVRKQQMTAPR